MTEPLADMPDDSAAHPVDSAAHPVDTAHAVQDTPAAPAVRVVVPMKPVATAKSRLSPHVGDVTREALTLLMLDRLVRAVVQALGAESCWVIGGDAYVRAVAEEAGAVWLPDPASDLNASVLYGMLRAFDKGSRAALFLPADVPMVTAEDIAAVVEASAGLTRPAGVEATADGGTNALLVSAGLDLTPALGHRSYSRHRLAAERAGTRLAPAPAFGLVFDLDTPDDLDYARKNVAGFNEDLARWEARVRQHWERIHPGPAWEGAMGAMPEGRAPSGSDGAMGAMPEGRAPSGSDGAMGAMPEGRAASRSPETSA